MIVFLNGRFLPASQARVSIFDHSFLYGDGLYETVRVDEGRVCDWPAHYRRLKTSAQSLALAIPWSSAYLEKTARSLARANRQTSVTIRVTISRGPGPLGLDPTLCPRPTLAMQPHPQRPLEKLWREGVSVMIARVRRNPPECLDPSIKSNSALNTVMAKKEAQKAGAFEALMLNLDGYLTEGTITNLFFVKKGKLFTPALTCGLLAGVARARVIRLARKMNRPVQEGRYTPLDLKKANEIFLTSSTLRVVPVVRVHSLWTGRLGPLTRFFQVAFSR